MLPQITVFGMDDGGSDNRFEQCVRHRAGEAGAGHCRTKLILFCNCVFWDISASIFTEIKMPKLNQQFQLSDGRKLGYDERGAPNGKPLFYFHGSPSPRVESNLFLSDGLLQSLNIRLISVLGLEGYHPLRISWLDLAALLTMIPAHLLSHSTGVHAAPASVLIFGGVHKQPSAIGTFFDSRQFLR